MQPTTPALSTTDFPRLLEDIVNRFEEAWERGPAPDLHAFLPVAPTHRRTVLLELIHVDLERRLKADLPVNATAYLRAFPELASDGSNLTELVATEAELRGRLGRSASLPENVALQANYGALTPHAHGGLGEVLLAEEPLLHRKVAIKLLQQRWASHPRAVRDFLREVEITSQLEHPGIVPIHGLGQTPDGRPCYCMRFVHGETLRTAIARYHEQHPADGGQGSVAFRALLTRFVAVCNTVAYAHSRGVLHRDLKPDNIMLGPYGETLVLDWGLARLVDSHEDADPGEVTVTPTSEQTQAGQVIGTPAYLSPEQASGERERIGPATDVFGLGATLYAILTGVPPYRGANAEETLQQARQASSASPRQRNPQVPRALEAVCRKAMAQRPEERYASAQELATDVENWLAGEPVRAWAEPWTVRLGRSLRRRRTLVAVLGVLLTVLPLAFGVGSWFVAQEQARARIDRQSAEVKEQAATQITDYLVRIFQTADPTGLDEPGFLASRKRPEGDTARDMLTRGAELVREHLHDQPVVRAKLLDALGNSYRALGDWDQAQLMLTEGLNLRQTQLGAEAVETEASLHSLARLYHERGEYPAAERLYRQLLEQREQRHGADHLLVAQTRFFLGWLVLHRPFQGPVSNLEAFLEAERLLQETLVVREKHLPANHRDLGLTLALLAAVKCAQNGQEAATLEYARRAMEVFRQNDQHADAGNVITVLILAELDRGLGRFDKAEKGYRKVLEVLRRHLGDHHPLTMMQLLNMAGLYRKTGDMVAAEQTLRQALPGLRVSPVRSKPLVVDAFGQLADHVRTRNPAEAKALYEEFLTWARERPEENAANIQKLQKQIEEIRNSSGPAKQP